MAAFSKKHYDLVAEALREMYQSEAFRYMPPAVEVLATMFAKDNPRFNRERFLEAVYKE